MNLKKTLAMPVRRVFHSRPHPRSVLLVAVAMLAAGCANQALKTDPSAAIRAEMDQATTARPVVVVPPQISDALQASDASTQQRG